MSNRKKIPAEVQKQVLLNSRRRCCLCFWLDGVDEVVKGQIAHLDQNASNNDMENLGFLCFKHHDEYDSKPNVSKGLQQLEVAQWRDELYKEMEYRFRSVRARKTELTITKFEPVDHLKTFRLNFRLKNVGEATIANVTLSIRLPDDVTAASPRKLTKRRTMSHPLGGTMDMGIDMSSFEMPELLGFSECTEDFFVTGGRVANYSMHPVNSVILPGHSLEIAGLGLRCEDYPDDTELRLDYRVDADDMDPQHGTVSKRVPKGLDWILQNPTAFDFPKDVTREQLEALVSEQHSD
mgnify:CR=1 FL=1